MVKELIDNMFVKIWLSEASSVCTQRNVNNLQIDCKMFKFASLFIKQCKQLFHIWWHFLINHDCDHTVNKLHKCVRVQCAHVVFHAHLFMFNGRRRIVSWLCFCLPFRMASFRVNKESFVYTFSAMKWPPTSIA